MHKLTMNEIYSVSGGDFNLYQDPIIPERVLLAPPPPVLVPWPICPAQPVGVATINYLACDARVC